MCEQQGYSFKCILKEKSYSIHSTTRGKDAMKNGREKGGDTRYGLNQRGNTRHELAIK